MIKAGDFVARQSKNSLFKDCSFAKRVLAVDFVYLKKQNRRIKVVKLDGYEEYIEIGYVVPTTPKEIELNNKLLKSIEYIVDFFAIEGKDPCISSHSGKHKMAYSDELGAYSAAYTLIKRDNKPGMVIYHCPICGNIHIGNKIENE